MMYKYNFYVEFTLIFQNIFSSLYLFDTEACWTPTVRRRVSTPLETAYQTLQ